jgi:hypothetical protein
MARRSICSVTIMVPLALAALGMTGCATMVTPSQKVLFDSDPSGAAVTVGDRQFTTPAKVTLSGKRFHVAVFRKDGYHVTEYTVRRKINPAYYFNCGWAVLGPIGLIPGLIGLAVDTSTGAAWKLYPSLVCVRLTPCEPGREPHVELAN